MDCDVFKSASVIIRETGTLDLDLDLDLERKRDRGNTKIRETRREPPYKNKQGDADWRARSENRSNGVDNSDLFCIAAGFIIQRDS